MRDSHKGLRVITADKLLAYLLFCAAFEARYGLHPSSPIVADALGCSGPDARLAIETGRSFYSAVETAASRGRRAHP
jgi:hypothetical protein